MSEPIYDQQLVNNADAAERCMTLGAVILKPPSQSTVGFTVSQPMPVDHEALARSIKRRRS